LREYNIAPEEKENLKLSCGNMDKTELYLKIPMEVADRLITHHGKTIYLYLYAFRDPGAHHLRIQSFSISLNKNAFDDYLL
jgi:hypothetical protein